jgi:hypothetical protein
MRRALRLLPAALLFALPGLAAAQGMARGAPQQAATPQPAPALPGLAARRAPAPIQGDPNANLSPNAALFDAIVRGDLAAARDAVTRGANLNARNELGLTPLDSAVDQGRNEIAFYLLSTRDLSRGPAEEPPPGTAASGRQPASAAALNRGAPQRPAESGGAAILAAAAAQRGSVPRSARLWANDGGAPQPQIGFLGFDAGRPAGAAPPSAQRRGGRG